MMSRFSKHDLVGFSILLLFQFFLQLLSFGPIRDAFPIELLFCRVGLESNRCDGGRWLGDRATDDRARLELEGRRGRDESILREGRELDGRCWRGGGVGLNGLG